MTSGDITSSEFNTSSSSKELISGPLHLVKLALGAEPGQKIRGGKKVYIFSRTCIRINR